MATLAADAILTAIKDVVEECHGTSRTITAATYRSGAYASLSALRASLKALTKPRAESRITRTSRSPASPPEPGSLALVDLDIEVRLVRSVTARTELDAACRRELRALAATDGDVLRQALGFPGNLTTTAGSVATTLVSGLLNYDGSDVGDLEVEAGQNGRLVTIHRFRGTAKVAQETA
ncbi:MAG: hypothetical protein AAGH15_21770 [Myxococcota bacterium]